MCKVNVKCPLVLWCHRCSCSELALAAWSLSFTVGLCWRYPAMLSTLLEIGTLRSWFSVFLHTGTIYAQYHSVCVWCFSSLQNRHVYHAVSLSGHFSFILLGTIPTLSFNVKKSFIVGIKIQSLTLKTTFCCVPAQSQKSLFSITGCLDIFSSNKIITANINSRVYIYCREVRMILAERGLWPSSAEAHS